MAAPVVRGFGRGSRQLGVPTANMDPEVLQGELQRLPTGVYFGWVWGGWGWGWVAARSGAHSQGALQLLHPAASRQTARQPGLLAARQLLRAHQVQLRGMRSR
jgi:hypothetical protein